MTFGHTRGCPRRGKELIEAGRLGSVQTLHFTWQAVSTGIDDKTWALDPVHDGYILDAGVHAFDLMRWYARWAMGGPRSQPDRTVEIVEAANRFNETGQAIQLPLGATG